MEQIHSNIVNLGYVGEAQVFDVFKEALTEGSLTMVFVDIVTWLSSQLVALCELESHVNPIMEYEDFLGFLVEVSSLLKELGCPIKNLTSGQIDDRLAHTNDKMLLIMYLSTELQAAKILACKKPKKKEMPMQIELMESKTAKEIREMLISLGFGKPPDTITPQQLFSELEKKIYTLSQPLAPRDMVGDILFSGYLTEKQWFQLDHLYQEMFQEYKNRRSLLLTRLDVTVKSFLWTDRVKNKADEIVSIYNAQKAGISVEPAVKISHVLAAEADLTVMEKTSSASVRKNTKSSVNKVIIGGVPDRGGRPEEQQPPPPEVPSWQKSDSSASRGGMKSSVQQSSSNYKNSRFNDENSSNRSRSENIHKVDVTRGGNSYRGGRGDYNVPVYQPVDYYCGQLGNPQFGFGGYLPAGDNFHQYGATEGLTLYASGDSGTGRGRTYNVRQPGGDGMTRGRGSYKNVRGGRGQSRKFH